MTPRLAAVPDPVLRDGIYIRVSAVMGRDDARFLSPDIQRQAIDRAREHGPASRVVDEYPDIDVSTRVDPAKRPGLQAALKAARAGEIDRLWILTLDRFDRDPRALATLDEIAGLGVELWTEVGRVDIESPEGYLSTGMQFLVARYQRDRIGKAWRQTHENRVARGLPHTPGLGRFGYTYNRDTGFTPDPTTAPILADLYARYIAGESSDTLATWLNTRGIPTLRNRRWSSRTLRRVLDSGFAAGLVRFHGENDGTHEPIITRETWDAYQRARKQRSRRSERNRSRRSYLLSGLATCGVCGSTMNAGMYGTDRQRLYYRCDSNIHTGTYADGTRLETAVHDWLVELARDVDTASDATLAAAARTTRRRADAELLEREIAALDNQTLRATSHLVEGVIDEHAYRLVVADIDARREDLRERAAAAREEASVIVDPARIAADLVARWDVLGLPELRTAVRTLLTRVTVTPGRAGRDVPVVITPTWSSPQEP